ncbi:glycerol-3-phosphate 1-O-acyltransferase PlsY [Paracoccaceae bacterium]|nr:glycerol-3-phosphate 1-O-acyltransferase PlsY [Paracoccaceae bacterium]
MVAFLIVLASYLIGSIPFGLVGGVFFKIRDPRTFGSKNIGATNILRSGNKKAAAFTLFFDMFKGFLAVLIASYVDKDIVYLAILSVVFGHIFPIYLLFKGGKGVATFLGALLSYSTVVGSLTLLTWIAVFYITKKSSVAGISSIALSNFFLFLFCDDMSIKISVLLLSIFILFKHSENIKRLLKREELSFEDRDKN